MNKISINFLTLLFSVAVALLLFTSCAAATDVSIRISNGKTVTLVKTGDVFDRAENERARVTTSGLFDDRERGRIFMRWVFGIHFKQPTMVWNVRVEDVTDMKPVLLIEDDSPKCHPARRQCPSLSHRNSGEIRQLVRSLPGRALFG